MRSMPSVRVLSRGMSHLAPRSTVTVPHTSCLGDSRTAARCGGEFPRGGRAGAGAGLTDQPHDAGSCRRHAATTSGVLAQQVQGIAAVVDEVDPVISNRQ
jgi:hypothetical protein